jgi:betaine reductase
MSPALLHAAYALTHAPDLVRYGSKPRRELSKHPGLDAELQNALRDWDDAVAYPPNQTFVGNLTPDDLRSRPQPWWQHPVVDAPSEGPFGPIMTQAGLYGLLKAVDDFNLIVLGQPLAEEACADLKGRVDLGGRLGSVQGVTPGELAKMVEAEAGLPLFHRGQLAAFIRRAHPEDDTLKAEVLLENLACKATAALALFRALKDGPIKPDDVDYLFNTGEEAVGDRYQRGAGSLAKAVAEVVGCQHATGIDLKAFCASPVHGLVIAAGLVQAEVFDHMVVLGGGSLAKLGMKFRGHLGSGVPIMEDMLGSMAFVIGPSNGRDPEFRLDAIGKLPIGAGSSPKAIYQALVIDPLERRGLKMTDVDRYAVELHNPEITLPAGGADVPLTNYRTLGALAVLRGEIEREQIDAFAAQRGMPGFAPTQGHIPAGVPFLGHARLAMLNGEMTRVMVVAKGSLFLGRMTQLVDGASFLLERP